MIIGCGQWAIFIYRCSSFWCLPWASAADTSAMSIRWNGNAEVTIFWALQSGTSAKGTNCGVQAPQAVWLWDLGSVVSSPPPLPAIFSYIQIKSELIFGHRCVSIRLQRWENRDKSGTPSQKRDKWASRDTSLKIETIPENPGMLAVVEVSRNALEGRSVAPKFVPLAFRGP